MTQLFQLKNVSYQLTFWAEGLSEKSLVSASFNAFS